MIAIADFLNTFTEFNSPNFPSARITFWLTFSESMVNESRWGVLYQQGVFLLTAHYLVLDSKNRKASYSDQLPGTPEGLDTSMTVDGVSFDTDINSIINEGAALFNTTTYGIQYYQIAKWKGSGPISLLGSCRRYYE